MRNQRDLKIEAARIRTLIADMDRTLRILDIDIATVEERTQTFDRNDPTYSTLARALVTRRDNLEQTISALENQLFEINAVTDYVLESA